MAFFQRSRLGKDQPTEAEIRTLLLREMSEDQPDWLWQTDAARRIINVSPRFAQACGRSADQLDGMPILQVLAGPAWDTGQFSVGLRLLADRLKSREGFQDLRLEVGVSDEPRWWELAASPRLNETGQFIGYIGVASDVTEQRESADKISRLARFDQLTGLPNRLLITEILERACRDAETSNVSCGILIFSVVNLNGVKSGAGYSRTERVLSRIAERIAQLADENSLVGNLTPGEFVVVWRYIESNDQLRPLIERYLEAARTVDDIKLDISSGLAVCPSDGTTAEELISIALTQVYPPPPTFSGETAPKANTPSMFDVGKSLRSSIAANGPAAAAGLQMLIDEHRSRLHNGPPEALNQAAMDQLQELQKELGNLVVLAEDDGAVVQKASLVASLTRSVFQFSRETGELFVAGLRPFLASVPIATGTLLLLEATCTPAIGNVAGPGAALAVLAGHFSLEKERRKSAQSSTPKP